MNNPRKCTSAECAEVRLQGKEFLLDLSEFFLENNIFYLGVQQTVTQVVFAGPSTTLLKQVGAPHLFAKPVARDHLVIFLQLPVLS